LPAPPSPFAGSEWFDPFGGFCNLAIQHGEILAEAVEFAQVPRDRRALVVGQGLTCEAGSAGPVEQLGMRARREPGVRPEFRGSRSSLGCGAGSGCRRATRRRRRSVSASGSQIASWAASGTHTGASSPAWCSLASVVASRRLVFTRSHRAGSGSATARPRCSPARGR